MFHHYVPQFHLRKFSNSKKYISSYLRSEKKYLSRVSIRRQAGTKDYYAVVPGLESALSQIEGDSASLLRMIEQDRYIPEGDLKLDLINYIVLLDTRTKGRSDELNTLVLSILESMGRIDKSQPISDPVSNLHYFNMVTGIRAAPILYDLKIGLLRNCTSDPFIISDDPVIKLNILHFTSKLKHFGFGYASKGLILFVPISKNLIIALYDSCLYKFGSRNTKYNLNIYDQGDIATFNAFQINSCKRSVYFTPERNQEFIESQVSFANKFLNYSGDRATIESKYRASIGQVNIFDALQRSKGLWPNQFTLHRHMRNYDPSKDTSSCRDHDLVEYFKEFYQNGKNASASQMDFINYVRMKDSQRKL